MRLIQNTGKALEYLSINNSGNIDDLKKVIAKDQIELVKRSRVLIIKGKDYKFTNEGTDIYCRRYASKERNFLGFEIPF